MAECSHDCSSCGENCSSRSEIQKEPFNAYSSVQKVIGVVSGKGGVGKSLVTSLLAVEMARRGYAVGIMDADITGPSIPQIFGVHEKAMGNDAGLFPAITESGIRLMSVNLLLENETDPVIWRGPVIGGVVRQFWTDVMWGDLDYLFIDMPPGTGDVALTVFQSLPVDGIITVTSPQELVEMIVGKAANMAKVMNIPLLGLVENMSYLKCPDCGKEISVFGPTQAEEIAEKYEIPVWERMPLDPAIAGLCDAGRLEDIDDTNLLKIADMLAI